MKTKENMSKNLDDADKEAHRTAAKEQMKNSCTILEDAEKKYIVLLIKKNRNFAYKLGRC